MFFIETTPTPKRWKAWSKVSQANDLIKEFCASNDRLFFISTRNYFIARVFGCLPSMFVTVAIGSGIEKVIDENAQLNAMKVITSPDIYIPLIGFFIILISAFILKKVFFKN